jgi:hypothetical protein
VGLSPRASSTPSSRRGSSAKELPRSALSYLRLLPFNCDPELKATPVLSLYQIISNIRHSTAYIRHLPPQLQAEATQSWAVALKTVFYIQAALAGLTFLFSLLLDEIPLGGKGAGEVSRVEDVEGDGAKKRRVVA